jgi:hypothetical protein
LHFFAFATASLFSLDYVIFLPQIGVAIAGVKQKWRPEMSLIAHIEELKEKHQTIQRQIELEMARPLVDGLKVSELKRRKLLLKEKIEKFKSGQDVALRA